ncbi:hypothetical protein DBV15_11507 [Temnothorax longispinosus]|uniref:Endonuclease/exonuclease/phosphatase domain-containing protein n=1 Tax=Temnothorax longispinosus TaxID=300112 RepID=A0A4S2KWC0_9HYME|nr:hypothetical protein DBV15_11507 [Temnothorax longispinosus]
MPQKKSTPPLCINCKGDHIPTFSICLVFVKQKQIIDIAARENISYLEARSRVENCQSSPFQLSPSNSFSAFSSTPSSVRSPKSFRFNLSSTLSLHSSSSASLPTYAGILRNGPPHKPISQTSLSSQTLPSNSDSPKNLKMRQAHNSYLISPNGRDRDTNEHSTIFTFPKPTENSDSIPLYDSFIIIAKAVIKFIRNLPDFNPAVRESQLYNMVLQLCTIIQGVYELGAIHKKLDVKRLCEYYDIIFLAETLLKPHHTYSIFGFNNIRHDSDVGKQGIALLICSNINYTPINLNNILNSDKSVEAIGVKISVNYTSTALFGLYRHPGGPCPQNTWQKIFNLANSFSQSLLLGNLNAHHPYWGASTPNSAGRAIMDILDRFPFILLNTILTLQVSFLPQELQALLSQKDIATSLAEDLLKHFGSDDLETVVKEEPSSGGVISDNGTLSSGPFSPSNLENATEVKLEKSEEAASQSTQSKSTADAVTTTAMTTTATTTVNTVKCETTTINKDLRDRMENSSSVVFQHIDLEFCPQPIDIEEGDIIEDKSIVTIVFTSALVPPQFLDLPVILSETTSKEGFLDTDIGDNWCNVDKNPVQSLEETCKANSSKESKVTIKKQSSTTLSSVPLPVMPENLKSCSNLLDHINELVRICATHLLSLTNGKPTSDDYTKLSIAICSEYPILKDVGSPTYYGLFKKMLSNCIRNRRVFLKKILSDGQDGSSAKKVQKTTIQICMLPSTSAEPESSLRGLKNIVIGDLPRLEYLEENVQLPSLSDVLWMCGKFGEVANIPGWRGFMETLYIELKFERSKNPPTLTSITAEPVIQQIHEKLTLQLQKVKRQRSYSKIVDSIFPHGDFGQAIYTI